MVRSSSDGARTDTIERMYWNGVSSTAMDANGWTPLPRTVLRTGVKAWLPTVLPLS